MRAFRQRHRGKCPLPVDGLLSALRLETVFVASSSACPALASLRLAGLSLVLHETTEPTGLAPPLNLHGASLRAGGRTGVQLR